jgi:hypothetical protein
VTVTRRCLKHMVKINGANFVVRCHRMHRVHGMYTKGVLYARCPDRIEK